MGRAIRWRATESLLRPRPTTSCPSPLDTTPDFLGAGAPRKGPKKGPGNGLNQGPALFSNAKITENHIQNILHVDPAGQPTERPAGEPQFFGNDILPAGEVLGGRPIQGGNDLFQRLSVPLPGD